MAGLDRYLTYLQKQGGSDLHLAAGLGPRLRRGGHLLEISGADPLPDDVLRSPLQELPSPDQWRQFESTGDLDFAYERIMSPVVDAGERVFEELVGPAPRLTASR